jgi:hypothetical protein
MAVTVTDVLALPREEREKLLEALMETTIPADIPPLLREFVARTERTNRVLESALDRRFIADVGKVEERLIDHDRRLTRIEALSTFAASRRLSPDR